MRIGIININGKLIILLTENILHTWTSPCTNNDSVMSEEVSDLKSEQLGDNDFILGMSSNEECLTLIITGVALQQQVQHAQVPVPACLHQGS